MHHVEDGHHLRPPAGRMKWRTGMEQHTKVEEELVEVLLRGKAPWGFTLRGGSEHGEPLVITKVEEGSKAAAVRLQAGDEMVSVNAVTLSGSRQEAICLVKSSHKTLTLLVRRKHDPASRPHSWHSSKLTEGATEPTGPVATTAPVWQPKHEASPGEFSSVTAMERLERPSHPHPRLPLPKHPSSEPPCGPKRDSAFSCLSSTCSPPIHDAKDASVENIFFKGPQSEEPPRYRGSGGWEEKPASRVSRAGVGPLWQLPEKKSQSPPPPPPPVRSDSFAVTKVFPYSEGRSTEKLAENNLKTSDGRRSFKPLHAKDLLYPNMTADYNHNQLHPNKLFSLSSNDVRQSQCSQLPPHQRQHSDESPLYLQTRSAPPTKIQSVGSYYRSLQDLPTNAFSRKHVRHSTAATPNLENGVHSRYYGLARPPQTATEIQARPGKRGETEKTHWETGFPGALKTKYSLPHGDNKERQTAEPPATDSKRHLRPPRLQDPWVPEEDQRISPLKTPLLHSLAQESRSLVVRQPPAAPNVAVTSLQDSSGDITGGGGKSNRRSDRYATTLRNEIQQKRAQLQKSRSAATLMCEDEEAEEEWRSTKTSTGVSFSNTYKDHLKEAQARVLQATSFQRRDLEPGAAKTSNERVRGRKRLPLAKRMHSFSEPDKIDKVGVEGGSFGERRKFFEAKPVFSRPVLKSNTNADPKHLSPGPEQVSLEQQRLGTFAEYQATWSKQKKSSEAKTQGRYHSAENILDANAEETAVCIHERSRSSPSADFYTKNVPSSPWRDTPSQQSSYRGKSEDRLQHEGLTDHKPDNPSHAAPSSGPRSSKPAAQLPESLLPPPRTHLGPETTSSSQEFLAGAQAADPTEAAQPRSGSPHLSGGGGGGGENDVEKERLPRSPSSSSSSMLSSRTAATPRSPSPQFAPLRLTDKPPVVFVQDETQLRSDAGLKVPADMEVNGSPARKVPVRIVHADPQREGRAYLAQTWSGGIPDPPVHHVPSPSPASFNAYTRQRPPDLVQDPPDRVQDPPDRVQDPPDRVQDPKDLVQDPPDLVQDPQAPPPESEDAKREELARDIMGRDKSLVDILDQSGRRTTMDLMEGLFPMEEQIMEGGHQRRRASASSSSRLPTSSSSPRSMDRREEEELCASAAASLVPSSSYYNTSAPKAELLIKMKDMQEELEEQDSEDELDVDLASKKQQLISSLARKLEVLREARHSLQEDVEDNEALGREVEATVRRLCQANHLDKFCMFVGDLDKVVSLLLSLSGRLARVENALNSLEEEAPPEEKRTLTEKRKLLMQQHEDAKELKENLDRRERLVSGVMEAHLDAASLDDYRHFVKMKSALIIEQRKLDDKIKLGEEQLKCLLDSLPLEQRPLL